MPLLCLPFILILLSIFSLFRNRSSRSFEEKQEAFWEKEQRANLSRKKDISGLKYIQIPLDAFPIGKFDDADLSDYERSLKALSGISNTDLKLEYGAANLPILSEYDANFTTLARLLSNYGSRLAELGYKQEAVTVLEFGIACRTDISKNYILLHQLYEESGEAAKADELADTVRASDLLLKDSILERISS